MAIDPLGEVYSGRDNTGAAYIIPRDKSTVLDTYLFERNKKAKEEKGLKDSLMAALNPGDLKAWEIDLPYFQKLRDDYTAKASQFYQNYGKDKQADAAAYQDLLQQKNMMQFHAANSWADKELDNKISENILSKKYAVGEESKHDAWRAMPTEQRLGTHPDMAPVGEEWNKIYGETPKLGDDKETKEFMSKTPGFTDVLTNENVDATGEWKPEVVSAAKAKAANWLTVMERPQIDAIHAAEKFIQDGNDPKLKALYDAAPTEKDKLSIAHDLAVEHLALIDLGKLTKVRGQTKQPIPQGAPGSVDKTNQSVDMVTDYAIDATTQVLKQKKDVDGKLMVVDGKPVMEMQKKGEGAAIQMNAKRAFPFATEALLKTVPGTIINMGTGKQESVPGGRDYRAQGVFELPYVIDVKPGSPTKGQKILVSKDTEAQYPGVIKHGWFVVGLQDAGTSKGEKVWEPRAIPFTASMKKQLETLPKGKVTMNNFPDDELGGSSSAPAAKATSAAPKEYTREELKAMSPSYTDAVIDAAVKGGKVKLKASAAAPVKKSGEVVYDQPTEESFDFKTTSRDDRIAELKAAYKDGSPEVYSDKDGFLVYLNLPFGKHKEKTTLKIKQ